jgi:argininosuccinate lyase
MMLENIQVKDNILKDEKYKYVFSVEEVNKLVLEGIPFREAYQIVGKGIASGDFNPDYEINHTHEGTIGNLCNDAIQNKFNKLVENFNFSKIDKAITDLLA